MKLVSTKLLFLGLFLGMALLCSAQQKEINEGNAAYKAGDYYTAADRYKAALSSSKLKVPPAKLAELQYRYAEASRKTYNYGRAEKNYGKVVKSEYTGKYPTAGYYYGVALKRNGKYDKAIKAFTDFRKMESKDKEIILLKDKAIHELKGCETAKELIAQPDTATRIKHLSDKVNTKYSDFSPHLIGNTLYYSSLRFERALVRGRVVASGPDVKQNLVGKIMVAENKGESRYEQLANKNINTKYENSGNSSTNTDESMLYFCKCAPNRDMQMVCEIYTAKMEENKEWGEAIKLPTEINLKGYTATHPAIGFDSIRNKEVLYFVSNRPGGKGKLDIWATEILGGNKFGEVYNLGDDINTEGEEITPFFHNATQSLYYSSDYTPGMGGYDIFNVEKEGDSFGTPKNVGIPLNSAANDMYFIINRGDTTGYFASNRPGSTILTGEACCNDLYELFLPVLPTEEPELVVVTEPKPTEEPEVVAVVPPEPEVVPEPAPKEPEIVKPALPEPEQKTLDKLNALLPLSLYFHNNEPRNTETSYSSIYTKYAKMKEEYKKEHVPQYNQSIQEQISDKIDDFFVDDVKGNYDKMHEFFDELIVSLENGFELEISIQGFTSPRASAAYNKLLAGRRIASVRIDMLSYKEGVLKTYLDNNKLRIKELPLGEGKAPVGVSDDIDDPRNSIYSVEAASQRKVNFIVVNMQDKK